MLVILLLATLIEVTFSSNGERNEVFAVGCNTFDDLVNSAAYVDKTLLIKEFFNNWFILITAPRRFGKSMNMDMIKTFCEVTVDNNGNRLPKNDTKNYKIFSENNLRIFQDRVFFDNNFGKYPTIFLDFKSLSCDNYQSFIESFKYIINIAYSSHEYLLHSDKLNEAKKNRFKMFYEEDKIKQVTDVELKHSITALTQLLYTHFNTKSIILIDEFDGPIREAINQAVPVVSDIFDFIMKFISVILKTNHFVNRGLINACVKLLTKHANNIELIPFLSDPKFANFYGLMESEVQDLLERFNMSEKINDVRLWYDGYQVPKTHVKMYNVYGIIRYLKSRELKSYWAQSVGVKNFEEILTFDVIRNKIELLLDDFESTGKGINIQCKDVININEILRLKEILDGATRITNDDSNLFFQYLTENGYFNVLREESNHAYIRIPNTEIKKEIHLRIESNFNKYYQSKFKNNYEEFIAIPRLFNSITKNNHLKCIKRIANSVQKCYYSREELPRIQSQLHRDLELSFKKSELFEEADEGKQAGKGRIDIALLTKNLNAFIIELKEDCKSSYEALQQMLARHYDDILEDSHKMKVYLVLHLSKKGLCTISYSVDSRDINKAHNVTGTFNRHRLYSFRPSLKKFSSRTGYTHRPGHTRRRITSTTFW